MLTRLNNVNPSLLRLILSNAVGRDELLREFRKVQPAPNLPIFYRNSHGSLANSGSGCILRRVRRAKQVLVSVPTTEDCGMSPDRKEDLVDFVQECVDVINSNVSGYSRQTSHLTMEHIFKL